MRSASRIVVPTGSASLVLGLHFSQVQASDHSRFEVDGRHIEVEAVHADHSGSRGPHSQVKAAAIGFVVCAGTRSVYFAGDTDLFAGMVAIGPVEAAIGPVEVALVPVWVGAARSASITSIRRPPLTLQSCSTPTM